ncbi:MAG: type II secretion system F family protein [Terracidiphilus sp.]|jgi:tight adherence protein B
MVLIFGLVFVGVFSLIALVAYGSMAGDRQAKQVIATLDSALATESIETRNEILNLRKSDKLSTIPWLNQHLLKLEIGPWMRSLLAQADLKWTVGGMLSMCVLCFVVPAYLVYWRTGSTPLAILIGAFLAFMPFAIALFKRSRRFGKFEVGLPEALDLMVSALRAGHSLIAAMGLVARECPDPIGTEFRICFEEQNYGLEMKTAIDNLLTRVPMQDLRIVATAIMIQKETGGNLAEVLDKVGWVIRERFRLKRQVATHTAQGRLTGIILTLLPVVLGIALYFVNPELMSILWTRPIGIKLLWVASIMIVIGGLIIRHIVNMEV